MPEEKRGTYKREPMTCQYCGAVFKGKAGLAKHVNAKHGSEDNEITANLAKIAGNKSQLAPMLRQVASWMESDGDVEIPIAFLKELQKQGAKAQVSLVMGSFEAMLDIVNVFTDLRTSEDLRRQYMTKEEMAKEYNTHEKVLGLQKQLKLRIRQDMELILKVHPIDSGDDKNGNIVVGKLVDMIREMQATLLGGADANLIDGSASELIPDKPSEREALRRELLRRDPSLSRLVQ